MCDGRARGRAPPSSRLVDAAEVRLHERIHCECVAEERLLSYLLGDLTACVGVEAGALEVAPEAVVLRSEDVDVRQEGLVAPLASQLDKLTERVVGPLQFFPPHADDRGMPLRRGLQPNLLARRPEPEKPLQRCARCRAAQGRLGQELHAQRVADERTLAKAAGELDGGSRVPDCLGEMLSAPKERRCEAYERSGSRERVVAGFL